MNQIHENEIEIRDNLTLENMEKISDRLLMSIISGENFNIDLSLINNIDLSGLQLLISFSKELISLNKKITFSGILKDEFKNHLKDICFTTYEMSTGEDLSKYIEDIK